MTDHTTRVSADKPEIADHFDDIITAIRSGFDTMDAALANCNFLGLAAPTVNDDSGDGYVVGSRWFYGNEVYECTDPTTGAAVWVKTYPAVATVTDDDVATLIHTASSKTPPVDADEVGLVDSEASNGLKKLTWSNLKAAVKTYTDTLYPLKSILTTAGDMVYATGASTWARLALGTQGYRLVAGASAPTWVKPEFVMGFAFGDGSALIATQHVGYVVPYAAKIMSVKIDSRDGVDGALLSGSATVTIHVHDYDAAIGTAVDTFALSSASSFAEAGFNSGAGWTVAAGKKVTCLISSITTCKIVTVSLVLEAT